MQKCGVNYWKNYAPVVNWISVGSLLTIASKHELKSRSIDFVISFSQYDLDLDVSMTLPLGMRVDGNIVGWVLKFKESLYGLNKASEDWFYLLKSCL